MSYTVHRTQNFKDKLSESASWLYEHNFETYGEEYADKKMDELHVEISALETRIAATPYIHKELNSGVPTTRVRSIYGGRYECEWEIDAANSDIYLTDFRDLKHPEELRYNQLDFDEE